MYGCVPLRKNPAQAELGRGTLESKVRTVVRATRPKNQRSLVNFERKILNYPKIILRRQHPPLTATNSEHLKILMGDAKEFRDSIVHQSPKTEDVLKNPDKVIWMQALRMNHVTQIVDAAVAFVAELNALLSKEGMPVGWLYPRDAKNGAFPPESFT